MAKKIRIAVILAVLGTAGAFGYVQLRWLLYTMKVREVLDQFPRFPSTEQVLGLKGRLQDAATGAHLPLETWSAKVRIEGRAAGPVRFYFVVATVKDGKRSFDHEKRVENQDTLFADREKIEAAGIEMTK